jgi:hypothetical protein
VASVEKVLQIVERHSMNHEPAILSICVCGAQEKDRDKCKECVFHFSNRLFFIAKLSIFVKGNAHNEKNMP